MIYHIEGEAIGTSRLFTGGLQADASPYRLLLKYLVGMSLSDSDCILFGCVLNDAIFIGEVA